MKTSHKKLNAWIEEISALCRPDGVVWCDGTQGEYDTMIEIMVKEGLAKPLNPQKRPGSVLFRSDPSDVARVENGSFGLTK